MISRIKLIVCSLFLLSCLLPSISFASPIPGAKTSTFQATGLRDVNINNDTSPFYILNASWQTTTDTLTTGNPFPNFGGYITCNTAGTSYIIGIDTTNTSGSVSDLMAHGDGTYDDIATECNDGVIEVLTPGYNSISGSAYDPADFQITWISVADYNSYISSLSGTSTSSGQSGITYNDYMLVSAVMIFLLAFVPFGLLFSNFGSGRRRY